MKKINFLPVILSVIFLLVSLTSYAQVKEQEIPVSKWLVAGPVSTQFPAFHNQPNLLGEKFSTEDLLKFPQKNISTPISGKVFITDNKKAIKWKKVNTNIIKPVIKKKGYHVLWQAFFLQVNRFLPLKVSIQTHQRFELFVNGEKKLSNNKINNDNKRNIVSLKLQPGKYLFIIKTLYNSKSKNKWEVGAKINFSSNIPASALSISTSDKKYMDVPHLLLGKKLKGVRLSSDGKYAMLNFSETYPPNGKTNQWVEIKDLKTNQIIFSSQHSKISQVKWVPNQNKISYVSDNGIKKALFIYDIINNKEKLILNNLKRFANYQWNHDGSYLIFSKLEKKKENKSGVFLLEGMPDRWPWYRNRTQLFLLNIDDLSVKQLTYGYLTNQLQDISPDNNFILISQSFPFYSKRPYTKQVMMQLNVQTLAVDTLWEASFGGQATYSPDGKKLLVMGSAEMFNGKGINLKKQKIPNDYDIQAYIYTIKNNNVVPVSKNFDPSIIEGYWNYADNNIYFLVQDKTYKNLWKYSPKFKKYDKLPSKVDVINQMDFSENSPLITYYGSSISYPATGWTYNLKTGVSNEISNPEKNFFKDIEFGKTKNWNFKNNNGDTIYGRIYFPPNYNPGKKYPLIVYYYGGTVPTDRTFGGRYPKNLYAAMGYIVYVLQPSGAIGFNQDFSALHVNGWGKQNARDIIEGTKKFITTHPSVNADAVGCIGASYGGYMTMYLQTQTNIFKTAIAHAGISDITSYWGQGYWGYLYSSVASANSFPWNNKKLYVNHSPLFNAEKINTPLLLLHGTADTNVPTGESIQLYTALKLLGKKVELVEIKGQNHHIIDYKKRILWQETIFAWFAKYLKNEPLWWKTMYPQQKL